MSSLAVDAHLRRSSHNAQADVLARREHDGPDCEGERAHGHQDEVLQGGLEDRSAAGQRIRGRPAGGRHDGAVRVDHADALSPNIDLEAEDVRFA